MEKITIGNLIRTLKPEYLKNKKSLLELKSFVETTCNLYFTLDARENGKDPVLRYGFREDSIPFDTKPRTKKLEYKNGIYLIPDERATIINPEEFTKQVEGIITSDFACGINASIDMKDSTITHIGTTTAHIHVTAKEKLKRGSRFLVLTYMPGLNKLVYEIQDFTEKPSLVDLPSEEIDVSVLPEYHRSVIGNKRLIKK